ncbi:MAG TPA: hypothetical protein VNF71_11315 [Acidimicrobiales bacterium]|nr:hypothetical protein [Acidimicrobiales bacterium]
MHDEEVTGRPGMVTTRIRGGALPGEVKVAIRGGTESFIAYADHEIKKGESILVYRSRGDRSVDVVEFVETGLSADEF